MDNSIKYEIVEKSTGNVYEVIQMAFGDEEVTASTVLGAIIFANKDKAGDLVNDLYAIREVGTHMQADGVGTIDDAGVPTE